METADMRQEYADAKVRLEAVRQWVAENPEHYTSTIRLQRAQADVKHWAKKLATQV